MIESEVLKEGSFFFLGLLWFLLYMWEYEMKQEG